MFVRQVKRKCSVRGCKNTECFAISRTREVGNTVIICKSCLGKALGAIDEIDPKTRSNILAIDNTAAPSLFFNAKALGYNEKTGEIYSKTNFAERLIHTENPDGPIADDSFGPIEKEPEQGSDVPPVDDVEDSTADVTPPEDATGFACSICGKGFDSEKGLKAHLRYCKPQTEK